MAHFLKTDRFSYEYSAEMIEDEILWESHCHPYYEMIAVFEGDVFVSPEGREYRLFANDVIIIPQLTYHTVRAAKKCRYRRAVIQFDPSALPTKLKEALSLGCLLFSSHRTEELCRVCLAEDTEFFTPLAECLAIELLYEGAVSSGEAAVRTEDHALASALSYIERNLASSMTLDEIALEAHMSKSAFCRLFTEKMKTSPKKYVLQKRMATAAKRLKEGVSPTLVAEALGYRNYSDFYRIYKKTFGVSPRLSARQP